MANVAAPDGSVVAFPEGMQPDAINAEMQKWWAAKNPPAPTPDKPFGDAEKGTWADIGNFVANGAHNAARSTGTGLIDAAAGLASLASGVRPDPGVILDQSQVPDGPPAILKPDEISAPVYGALGMTPYRPTSLPGKLWQAGSSGALLGAPGGVWSGVLGGMSGIGGEVGGEIGSNFGPGWQTAGSIAGSLAAPLGPGMYAASRGALANIVRRNTATMTDGDWAAATNLQDRSRALGTPLLATEAMDSPNLAQFTSDTRASRAGAPALDQFLNARPGQVRQAVADEILDPITAAPLTTGSTAEKVQNAAESAIQAVERARSTATRPFYQAAATDTVPADQVTRLVNHLDGLISADPGNLNPSLRQARNSLVQSDAVPAVPATRGQYVNGTYQPATPGTPAQPLVPFTDIETLDRARKILRDKVELPPTGADALGQTAASETGGQLGQLRDAMTRASPDFAAGRALHEQISQDTVAPLQRSDIGTLADRAGIPENRGIQSQINTIANPDTARPDQIRFVANHLNFADRTAFPELARTYFENTFNRVQKGPRGAPDNPASGVDFSRSVNGTPQQRANNQAILEGVAQAHGIPVGGLQAGFDNAMEVFDRMGRVPGIGSPTASRTATNAELSSGPGVGLSRITLDKPSTYPGVSSVIGGLGEMYMSRAYRQFAQMITSPDGVQQLRRLSMLNPQGRQAQLLVGQMAGLVASGEQR